MVAPEYFWLRSFLGDHRRTEKPRASRLQLCNSRPKGWLEAGIAEHCRVWRGARKDYNRRSICRRKFRACSRAGSKTQSSTPSFPKRLHSIRGCW
jgi:hypothetical protein